MDVRIGADGFYFMMDSKGRGLKLSPDQGKKLTKQTVEPNKNSTINIDDAEGNKIIEAFYANGSDTDKNNLVSATEAEQALLGSIMYKGKITYIEDADYKDQLVMLASIFDHKIKSLGVDNTDLDELKDLVLQNIVSPDNINNIAKIIENEDEDACWAKMFTYYNAWMGMDAGHHAYFMQNLFYYPSTANVVEDPFNKRVANPVIKRLSLTPAEKKKVYEADDTADLEAEDYFSFWETHNNYMRLFFDNTIKYLERVPTTDPVWGYFPDILNRLGDIYIQIKNIPAALLDKEDMWGERKELRKSLEAQISHVLEKVSDTSAPLFKNMPSICRGAVGSAIATYGSIKAENPEVLITTLYYYLKDEENIKHKEKEILKVLFKLSPKTIQNKKTYYFVVFLLEKLYTDKDKMEAGIKAFYKGATEKVREEEGYDTDINVINFYTKALGALKDIPEIIKIEQDNSIRAYESITVVRTAYWKGLVSGLTASANRDAYIEELFRLLTQAIKEIRTEMAKEAGEEDKFVSLAEIEAALFSEGDGARIELIRTKAGNWVDFFRQNNLYSNAMKILVLDKKLSIYKETIENNYKKLKISKDNPFKDPKTRKEDWQEYKGLFKKWVSLQLDIYHLPDDKGLEQIKKDIAAADMTGELAEMIKAIDLLRAVYKLQKDNIKDAFMKIVKFSQGFNKEQYDKETMIFKAGNEWDKLLTLINKVYLDVSAAILAIEKARNEILVIDRTQVSLNDMKLVMSSARGRSDIAQVGAYEYSMRPLLEGMDWLLDGKGSRKGELPLIFYNSLMKKEGISEYLRIACRERNIRAASYQEKPLGGTERIAKTLYQESLLLELVSINENGTAQIKLDGVTYACTYEKKEEEEKKEGEEVKVKMEAITITDPCRYKGVEIRVVTEPLETEEVVGEKKITRIFLVGIFNTSVTDTKPKAVFPNNSGLLEHLQGEELMVWGEKGEEVRPQRFSIDFNQLHANAVHYSLKMEEAAKANNINLARVYYNKADRAYIMLKAFAEDAVVQDYIKMRILLHERYSDILFKDNDKRIKAAGDDEAKKKAADIHWPEIIEVLYEAMEDYVLLAGDNYDHILAINFLIALNHQAGKDAFLGYSEYQDKLVAVSKQQKTEAPILNKFLTEMSERIDKFDEDPKILALVNIKDENWAFLGENLLDVYKQHIALDQFFWTELDLPDSRYYYLQSKDGGGETARVTRTLDQIDGKDGMVKETPYQKAFFGIRTVYKVSRAPMTRKLEVVRQFFHDCEVMSGQTGAEKTVTEDTFAFKRPVNAVRAFLYLEKRKREQKSTGITKMDLTWFIDNKMQKTCWDKGYTDILNTFWLPARTQAFDVLASDTEAIPLELQGTKDERQQAVDLLLAMPEQYQSFFLQWKLINASESDFFTDAKNADQKEFTKTLFNEVSAYLLKLVATDGGFQRLHPALRLDVVQSLLQSIDRGYKDKELIPGKYNLIEETIGYYFAQGKAEDIKTAMELYNAYVELNQTYFGKAPKTLKDFAGDWFGKVTGMLDKGGLSALDRFNIIYLANGLSGELTETQTKALAVYTVKLKETDWNSIYKDTSAEFNFLLERYQFLRREFDEATMNVHQGSLQIADDLRGENGLEAKLIKEANSLGIMTGVSITGLRTLAMKNLLELQRVFKQKTDKSLYNLVQAELLRREMLALHRRMYALVSKINSIESTYLEDSVKPEAKKDMRKIKLEYLVYTADYKVPRSIYLKQGEEGLAAGNLAGDAQYLEASGSEAEPYFNYAFYNIFSDEILQIHEEKKVKNKDSEVKKDPYVITENDILELLTRSTTMDAAVLLKEAKENFDKTSAQVEKWWEAYAGLNKIAAAVVPADEESKAYYEYKLSLFDNLEGLLSSISMLSAYGAFSDPALSALRMEYPDSYLPELLEKTGEVVKLLLTKLPDEKNYITLICNKFYVSPAVMPYYEAFVLPELSVGSSKPKPSEEMRFYLEKANFYYKKKALNTWAEIGKLLAEKKFLTDETELGKLKELYGQMCGYFTDAIDEAQKALSIAKKEKNADMIKDASEKLQLLVGHFSRCIIFLGEDKNKDPFCIVDNNHNNPDFVKERDNILANNAPDDNFPFELEILAANPGILDDKKVERSYIDHMDILLSTYITKDLGIGDTRKAEDNKYLAELLMKYYVGSYSFKDNEIKKKQLIKSFNVLSGFFKLSGDALPLPK